MITVIPNQPIRLRDTTQIDTSCECMGQGYCQLINRFDGTQFQIRSSNLVSNGDFIEDLEGWNIYESINVELVSISNVSFGGNCDGSVVVSASGGTGPYTYSLNVGTPQVSGTFTGLCEGNYYITAFDSLGNEGAVFFGIAENIDCTLYAGSEANDLILIDSSTTLNCYANNFI